MNKFKIRSKNFDENEGTVQAEITNFVRKSKLCIPSNLQQVFYSVLDGAKFKRYMKLLPYDMKFRSVKQNLMNPSNTRNYDKAFGNHNNKKILITQIIKNQQIVHQRPSHVFLNFLCSFCQRTYSSIQQINYHVKHIHEGVQNVKIIKLNLDIKQFKFIKFKDKCNTKMVQKGKNVEVMA